MRISTHLDHTGLPDLVERLGVRFACLLEHERALARDLVRRVRDRPDLCRRFDLARSRPGIGPIVAVRLVVRTGARSGCGPARRRPRVPPSSSSDTPRGHKPA